MKEETPRQNSDANGGSVQRLVRRRISDKTISIAALVMGIVSLVLSVAVLWRVLKDGVKTTEPVPPYTTIERTQ